MKTYKFLAVCLLGKMDFKPWFDYGTISSIYSLFPGLAALTAHAGAENDVGCGGGMSCCGGDSCCDSKMGGCKVNFLFCFFDPVHNHLCQVYCVTLNP